MPRKAMANFEVFLEIMQNSEIFDENEQLKSRSDKVWKEASLNISDKLLPNTLNFYLRNNRWNLKNKLEKYFNITAEEKDEEEEIEEMDSNLSDFSQEFQPYDLVENINNKLPKFWFDLTLADDQW
ncbi:unnamed protein product [Psylliodes chrysocephalus]|uniref:Uncharacterized protein n=1 Tax=Psylliodes chrysocephalus TaxID=3402493 RepID=A0A9P0CVY1_9CUCU|nr:unnamed protein product [Psylliodes chrysocephala]